jgi:hypothetical protein
MDARLAFQQNGNQLQKARYPMSESGLNGPFNISHWLNQGLGMSVGGDDIGDGITLGETNQLTGGESGNATIVQNSANVNMAFAARNLAGESDVVGVYGGSDGSRGISIGVAGACDAGCGVAGVATAASVTALPSSVGVFGAGDFHGVYGVSGALASQTPDLKALSISGETVAVAGANGTVDQQLHGGTARAPAVLGLNGILADDIKKTNFHAAAGDIVTEASGVEGVGVNGTGVVGISFAPGRDPDTQDLPVIDPTVGQHLNGPIADPLNPILNVKAEPAGVIGLGLGFDPDPASAEGLGFGSPGVRGISAHMGDLFAVIAEKNDVVTQCSLWFCVRTGGIPLNPAAAQWAQVALFGRVTQLVPGSL